MTAGASVSRALIADMRLLFLLVCSVAWGLKEACPDGLPCLWGCLLEAWACLLRTLHWKVLEQLHFSLPVDVTLLGRLADQDWTCGWCMQRRSACSRMNAIGCCHNWREYSILVRRKRSRSMPRCFPPTWRVGKSVDFRPFKLQRQLQRYAARVLPGHNWWMTVTLSG